MLCVGVVIDVIDVEIFFVVDGDGFLVLVVSVVDVLFVEYFVLVVDCEELSGVF